MGYSRLVLKIGVIDLDLQVILAILTQNSSDICFKPIVQLNPKLKFVKFIYMHHIWMLLVIMDQSTTGLKIWFAQM